MCAPDAPGTATTVAGAPALVRAEVTVRATVIRLTGAPRRAGLRRLRDLPQARGGDFPHLIHRRRGGPRPRVPGALRRHGGVEPPLGGHRGGVVGSEIPGRPGTGEQSKYVA